MATDPESLYIQLGRLIEAMPSIPEDGPLSREVLAWCGRAYALTHEAGKWGEATDLKLTCDKLPFGNRSAHVVRITTILHRVLAVAELKAPATAQGAFIPAGNAFDALAAVGKVLQSATKEVMIVDPYMDEKALTDFGVLATEAVSIRLLSDAQHVKATLKPAVSRWQSQFGSSRPLEARLAAPRSLHDRLIIVDERTAWVLTQSLNAFAARAPASIVRTDAETTALKVTAYGTIWQDASLI